MFIKGELEESLKLTDYALSEYPEHLPLLALKVIFDIDLYI